MWVIFTKTCWDKPGCVYPKGKRVDLSEEDLQLIDSKYYKKSRPFWEDHIDPKSIKKAAQKEAIDKAAQQVAHLQEISDKAAKEAEICRMVFEASKARADKAYVEHEKILKLSNTAAKKLANAQKPKDKKEKSAYDKKKQKAAALKEKECQLADIFNRAELEAAKAEGELKTANAVEELADLDVRQARDRMDELTEPAKEKKAKGDGQKDVKKQTDTTAADKVDKPQSQGQTGPAEAKK